MKKITSIIMSIMMLLSVLFVPNAVVYAADASISVDASSVKIGDTITVTVAVPDGVTASLDVSYPNNLVKFTNCSITGSDNGSSVSLTMGVYAPQSPKTATITFSALAAGTADFAVTCIKAGDEMGDEITLGGASVSVTIENKASEEQPVVLSDNNLLGSLQISPGTLSPSFHANTTSYKTTVGYNVSKVSVSAVAAHEKAKITSLTGGTNLKVGDNTISIVVQAENGVSKTYTIVVTRQQNPSSEEPDDTQTPSTQKTDLKFKWNGTELKVVDSIPKNVIPADFEKNTKMINNQEVPVLSFKNGTLTALYLSNKSGENGVYVYDETTQDVYPFVSLGSGENYVVVLRPDDAHVPGGYTACTLSLEGKGVISAYQHKDDALNEFYLMYGMNSQGKQSWYMYDIMEKTFQRFVLNQIEIEPETEPDTEVEIGISDEQVELQQAKKMQIYIAIGAAAIIVVLLIVIIVLALKLASKSIDEELEEELKAEKELKVEEVKPVKKVVEKPVVTKKSEETDDGSDLEFIDLD